MEGDKVNYYFFPFTGTLNVYTEKSVCLCLTVTIISIEIHIVNLGECFVLCENLISVCRRYKVDKKDFNFNIFVVAFFSPYLVVKLDLKFCSWCPRKYVHTYKVLWFWVTIQGAKVTLKGHVRVLLAYPYLDGWMEFEKIFVLFFLFYKYCNCL